MVDLHIHTRNSSGTDSLEDILKKAENKKLKVISITDNENIEIYDEVKDNNVRNLFSGKIITGTEIKTMFDGVVIDVLAYDFDPEKLKDSPIVILELVEYDWEKQIQKVMALLSIRKRLGKPTIVFSNCRSMTKYLEKHCIYNYSVTGQTIDIMKTDDLENPFLYINDL